MNLNETFNQDGGGREVYSLLAMTVVVVQRSVMLRVVERDELSGKMSFSSVLPQYLITAMFTGA